MSLKDRYSHKGWFYFVPVYLKGIEDGQDLEVSVRWLALEPLMDVADFIHRLICTLHREDIMFPFRITGVVR